MNAPERPALRHPGKLDGIDVSWCQQGVNYQRVADAGFRFVVVKISEGLTGADPMRATHIKGFRDVGMYVLGYHFMRVSKGKPREQVLKMWDSMGDIYMPMCLDFETRDPSHTTQQHVDFMVEAAETVATLGALRPLLYTYPWFAETMQPALGASRLAELCDLWMAYIRGVEPYAPLATELPKVPKPWTSATLWQYGGNGGYRVPGVPGACDRNLYLGDEEAFRTRVMGLPDQDPRDLDPVT